MTGSYRYFLSITSQLPFCGIPFRLDSYSICQFQCRYCFAADRGGAFNPSKISEASPSSLRRRLNRLLNEEPRSVLDQMLAARIPLHFGGMSDPFMPVERKRNVTLAILEVLADHRYPAILSTKGELVAGEDYIRVLAKGVFAVQFSFSALAESVARQIEPGVPSPASRLRAIESVARSGIPTAVRLQPYLPSRLSEARQLLKLSADAGARHAAVEHLKLPVEKDAVRRRQLNQAVGYDLGHYYAKCEAERIGREWVLPVKRRLNAIKKLGTYARGVGMTFGAADSDLLHLSDGSVCCSGADLLGMGQGFEFNFLTAVRKGMDSGFVTFDLIADAWRPLGSIAQYVNSNSRSNGRSTIDQYIKDRWNGVSNGPSPRSFFGVLPTDRFDANGYRIYRYQKCALD